MGLMLANHRMSKLKRVSVTRGASYQMSPPGPGEEKQPEVIEGVRFIIINIRVASQRSHDDVAESTPTIADW